MALELSIIIPTNDLQYEKRYRCVNGGGRVFNEGRNTSLWSTAIYELWDGSAIYFDVSKRLKNLSVEFDFSEYHRDFSKKTQDDLEAEKNRVAEGLNILKRLGYSSTGIYEEIKFCIEAAESYVKTRDQVKKTKELVKRLEIRIRHLQMRASEIPLSIIKDVKKALTVK